MAEITLRSVKGTPLTNNEVDDNFNNLNLDIISTNSNVGIKANLTTTNNSNLVAAINEVNAALSTIESVAISNANSEVRITGSNGTIYANANGVVGLVITEASGVANVKVSGNLQDNTGRTLRILDESNTVIWGS